VDSVIESAAAYPGERVKEVRLRIGALASFTEDSLQFCWEIMIEGTPLEGSKPVAIDLPVVVHCQACGKNGELESPQSFRCPHCDEPASDLPQGRELEIAAGVMVLNLVSSRGTGKTTFPELTSRELRAKGAKVAARSSPRSTSPNPASSTPTSLSKTAARSAAAFASSKPQPKLPPASTTGSPTLK
jgi:hydrogenase nickel incorporation protein HypA/HybF